MTTADIGVITTSVATVADTLIATAIDALGAQGQMRSASILDGQCQIAAIIFDDHAVRLRTWLVTELRNYHNLTPSIALARRDMIRQGLYRRWRRT